MKQEFHLLNAISLKDNDQSAISVQLMDQMENIGFCLIKDV
jgi:isopenicillin N synthase-like dioxygenase